MAGFVKLLMIAFTAAMVENAIFSRALVTRKMLFLKNREEILTFSAVITLMTVISGVLCSFNRYNLWERLVYCVGTGVGVTLALVLLDVANQNIAMSRVPRIFRGLPRLLLYIGILSLAFYGLIGHPITF